MVSYKGSINECTKPFKSAVVTNTKSDAGNMELDQGRL